MELFRAHAKELGSTLWLMIKWLLLALLVGVAVGAVSIAFSKGMAAVTATRLSYSWMIYLLPLGGLAVVGVYHLFRYPKDGGTSLVISSIHSHDNLPFRMLPCIFLGTLLTHLVGGSAGREGAALQIGGSIGNQMGKWFRMTALDRKVLIVCGMSAAFAALFGTPMAAAVFALEVVSVGVMHYAALVPSVFAGFIGSQMASWAGIAPERFLITQVPTIHLVGVGRLILLAVLCAILARLFCILLHTAEHLYQKYIPNPFLRVAVGGALVLGITLLIGSRDYLGAGMNIIEEAVEGHAVPWAFALKMLLTALTLGAGFKGGEIVPSLFVGATFGAVFAAVTGAPPAISAALGMVSLFCGVTNCPLATLVLSFEMFGLTNMPYFFIAIAISYLVSGYYSLYHSQRFVCSKEKAEMVTRHAK